MPGRDPSFGFVHLATAIDWWVDKAFELPSTFKNPVDS